MNIVTYNRTHPSLGDWARDLDGLFGQMDQMLSPFRSDSKQVSTMPCDIHESETGYLLSFDVPGFSKSDLSIEVDGDQVLVSGERKKEESLKGVRSHRTERFHGKFSRTFTVPKGIDANKIKANCENGVLHLMIPKADNAKVRKIEISEGKSGFLHGVKEKLAKSATN